MAPTQQQLEFLSDYVTELKDLTIPSKPKINALTMLAEEHRDVASSVAAAIEKHILSCPPPIKLPALYLIDSIVRSPDVAEVVRAIYNPLFARNLPEVFIQVWRSLPERQPALQKLLGMWRQAFPAKVLDIITRQVESSQAGCAKQAPGAPYLASQLHSTLVAVRPPQQPAVRPVLATVHQGVQAPVQLPLGARPALGPAPVSPLRTPAAVTMRAQYHQPAAVLSNGAHPASQPQQHQPLYPATAPVPHQPAGGPFAAPAPYQAPAPAQQPPGDVNHLLASLLQAGMLSAALQTAPQPFHPGMPAQQPEVLPPPPARRHRTTEFTADVLKERDEALIQSLLSSPDALRASHADRQLRARRRQVATKASRQWYVGLDAWMTGTTADPQAVPDFFADEATAPAAKPKEVFSAPADDAQPNCALSGEKFETFWDDKHEEWRYKDAKRLGADEAARYGLPEGSLVLASCLAPAATGDDVVLGSAAVVEEAKSAQSMDADMSPDLPSEATGADTGSAAAVPEAQHEPSMAADLAARAAANADEAGALIQEFLRAQFAPQAQHAEQEQPHAATEQVEQLQAVKAEPEAAQQAERAAQAAHAVVKQEPQRAEHGITSKSAAGTTAGSATVTDSGAAEVMDVGEGSSGQRRSKRRGDKRKSDALAAIVKVEPGLAGEATAGGGNANADVTTDALTNDTTNIGGSSASVKRQRPSPGPDLVFGDQEMHFQMQTA